MKRHAVEHELHADLKKLFDQENHVPPERDVLNINDLHERHHELVLRSVTTDQGKKKLLPQLRKLFVLCGSNDALFSSTLQGIVLQTGVSTSLQSALWVYFDKIPFDFLSVGGQTLNPNYRYSRVILDYKVLYR
ncbi:hypothetical protein [Prosthecobacter vanneervenii]|nr:hypothetical protein [Prosthecobacter vanneervenii]